MSLNCSITGKPINGISDAVWDDGEWVSWDYINSCLEENQDEDLLERLIAIAKEYFEEHERHLPIYGEIGELYAERRFNIQRHRARVQGSDGKMGDAFVEVKTITPENKKKRIQAKRLGNFSKLVVVKIDEDFRIDARIVDRKSLPKGPGKFFHVSWESISPEKLRDRKADR